MIKLIFALTFVCVLCGAERSIDPGFVKSRYESFLPEFLKKASLEARKEYYNILKQPNNTIAQEKEKILAWAKKNKVEDEYKKREDGLKKLEEERNKNVLALISKLPNANSEYVKIIDNLQQTRSERLRKLREFMKKHIKEYRVVTYMRALARPEMKIKERRLRKGMNVLAKAKKN
ncbi:hypothetical protein OESDEN_14201 [Oesophagostomum dentatum]|uniref:SXP/RAL-2 family protein Ani s 5-like cation-binding domain-containing protein n=1 Tax=Oesophagostomum dentatum TaxID=61180 RepID=A0A0B1SS78_OESDE|nr:hypothetical protein OESDEN_14201 [Oesophagostomum dentatum]